MNGGPPQTGEHMLTVGTYNALIEPNEFYCPMRSTFDASHKTFKRMMPTFAWEVLEVYSGPPKVAFKWRHWGTMKEDYVGTNPYVFFSFFPSVAFICVCLSACADEVFSVLQQGREGHNQGARRADRYGGHGDRRGERVLRSHDHVQADGAGWGDGRDQGED